MVNKWLKLNASWMESEWLITLSAEARLAWIQLLCYTKTHGFSGRVKVKPAMVFARQSFIGEESVEQMLRAAKKDGALDEQDGNWIITGWTKHQGDEGAADRMRRLRSQRTSQNEPEDLPNVTDGSGSSPNKPNVTLEEKRGEEKRVNTPKPPVGDWTWKKVRDAFAAQMPESHHKPITEFCAYHRDLKTKPWTEQTILKRAETWGAWPAGRFRAAVDHTILKGWKGLAEPEPAGGVARNAPTRSGAVIRREVGAPDA